MCVFVRTTRSFDNQRSESFYLVDEHVCTVHKTSCVPGNTRVPEETRVPPVVVFVPVFLQMSSFREDVSKLREAAAQQGDIRQTVRDKDEIIRGDRPSEPQFHGRGASSFVAHLPEQKSSCWLSFVFIAMVLSLAGNLVLLTWDIAYGSKNGWVHSP